MSEDFEIKNKVAESGLVNFDLSALSPKCKTEPENDTTKKRAPIVFGYCVDDFV